VPAVDRTSIPAPCPESWGLGTGGLFVDDVAKQTPPQDGYLPVMAATPEPERLATLAAPPERRQWWIDRITACHPLLR
jgi:o-succinylbenzoate synthase